MLGGATSWSGGWMWVPLNPLSQADGIIEDIDAPRTYLKHALGENYDEPRVEALLENGRHMVGVLREPHRPAVRVRHVDRRHPGRPSRGRHRRAIGRPQADQHAADHEVASRQAAPAAVRDVVARAGDHGRPRPAGLPARDDVGQGVLPRRLASRLPRLRPDHPPAGHAAGQRHGADRPAGQVGRRPRCAPAGEHARQAAAHRRRRRDGRGARRSGRGGHRPGSARCPSRGRRFPQRRRPSPRAVSADPDRTGALDPRAGGDHRRRSLARRVGGRPARHVAGVSCRVVPGLAGALPQRTSRHLPAHRRPRQARPDRGPVRPASGSSTRPTATTSSPRQ